jgi:hypothetical protein
MSLNLVYAATVVGILFFSAVDGAEAQVIALNPTPHNAGCADFHKNNDGSWSANGSIQINNSVTLGAGVSFSEAVQFGNINIAGWLDRNCK